MRLSGLEPFIYRPNLDNPRSTFINIGERCNVAGSMMYKKAIVDGDYDKAHGIALKQVMTLCAIIDVWYHAKSLRYCHPVGGLAWLDLAPNMLPPSVD